MGQSEIGEDDVKVPGLQCRLKLRAAAHTIHVGLQMILMQQCPHQFREIRVIFEVKYVQRLVHFPLAVPS